MERPLPYFTSYGRNTAACSISQTEEHEDCSSLYLSEPITETAGDPVHKNKSSLVTGLVADRAKEPFEKSQLVTGRIEHKILRNRPPTAAQKT